jgi:hypothetical protein
LALDQVLENLGRMFDHFWDFDMLVEDEHPGEVEIMRSRPLLRDFCGIRVYVTGMGCRPMGLPMFRPHL